MSKSLFLLLMLSLIKNSYALSIVSNEKMICDFKYGYPLFFEYKNIKMSKISEIGLVGLDRISMKFLVDEVVEDDDEYYAYGSLLIINDFSEKFSPSPIGDSFVIRNNLLCIRLSGLMELFEGDIK